MKNFRTLSLPQSSPAAGAGFALQPSQVARVKFRSIMFDFATDATVANREVWLQIADINGMPVFQSAYNTTIPASQGFQFCAAPTYASPTLMYGSLYNLVGLPLLDMWLPPGWQVQVGARGIDAGDQFSAITYAADFGEDVWDQNEDMVNLAAILSGLN